MFTVVIPPTEPPSICSRSLQVDFLKRLSLIVSTSDQVVHISDITVVVVIVQLDIIVDIVVHLDIVATESCDDEVVVSTWFPRNAVAKLAGVVVIILPMVVMN